MNAMWKCPDCGFEEGPVFDIYSGHHAYYTGGVTLRCANHKTVTGKGYSHSDGCAFEVHVKRDELVQLVLGFAAQKAKAVAA